METLSPNRLKMEAWNLLLQVGQLKQHEKGSDAFEWISHKENEFSI